LLIINSCQTNEVWDVAKNSLAMSYDSKSCKVPAMEFSPDRKFLAIVDKTDIVVLTHDGNKKIDAKNLLARECVKTSDGNCEVQSVELNWTVNNSIAMSVSPALDGKTVGVGAWDLTSYQSVPVSQDWGGTVTPIILDGKRFAFALIGTTQKFENGAAYLDGGTLSIANLDAELTNPIAVSNPTNDFKEFVHGSNSKISPDGRYIAAFTYSDQGYPDNGVVILAVTSAKNIEIKKPVLTSGGNEVSSTPTTTPSPNNNESGNSGSNGGITQSCDSKTLSHEECINSGKNTYSTLTTVTDSDGKTTCDVDDSTTTDVNFIFSEDGIVTMNLEDVVRELKLKRSDKNIYSENWSSTGGTPTNFITLITFTDYGFKEETSAIYPEDNKLMCKWLTDYTLLK
jgi:hypothetical protein